MEMYYYVVFGVLMLVLGALELSKSSKDRVATTSAFTAFKNNYLVVYSLMMGMPLSLPPSVCVCVRQSVNAHQIRAHAVPFGGFPNPNAVVCV